MLNWLRRSSDVTPVTTVTELLTKADAERGKGETSAAIKRYAAALALDPASQYALYWLATCYEESGSLDLAAKFCARGLAIDSTQIGLLLRGGSIAAKMLDHYLALDYYAQAAMLDPEIPQIDGLLADQYCFVGNVGAALQHFDQALLRDPASIRLQSSRLFIRNYTDAFTREQLFEEHVRWGAQHQQSMPGSASRLGRTVRPEKLTVGYVSPDLRNHAVAFFVETLLRLHDRERFNVVVFDTSPYPEDEITLELKSIGHQWRRVGHLDDLALCTAIRERAVDILIDLSGHTAMNRLGVFAQSPATVQATWLGYLSTTGLEAMDYRITDGYLDPPGMTESLHTERLIRLPNAACFVPYSGSPPVSELPARSRSGVTFGSMNQWPKVTDRVKDVWADILREVANSRLLVLARGGQNDKFAAEIRAAFGTRGIDPRRILVRTTGTLLAYLQHFQEIDISLDPFPYGGGTTTMHSLWMGVPVVTLQGATAFSRNSVGPLTEVGLDSLITGSVGAYVAAATALAHDLETLGDLRTSLRQRMRVSPLLDQPVFTANMELAYDAMWKAAISTQSRNQLPQ